ncbi:MAG: HlyD family type I secretion periplasmic adaptor subunit, partial [Planctomycetes bacterium]|nr:HlyD family type I secretion periplasmic adaptor subunit [Planctomycetota bacterium]
MKRLDELIEKTPTAFRLTAWVVVTLLAAFVAWAYFADLDEVAVAYGEVVPQGQVKVIQHLEGGIIEKIYVVEGSVVNEGDPLVQLDLTATGASREELALRLDSLLLIRARLNAEADGVKLKFPQDLEDRRPALLAGERKAFVAHQAEFDSVLQVLREQERQREFAVVEIKVRKVAVERDLELANVEFAMSSELLEASLTPKIEHLRLQREVEKLKGKLASLTAGIPLAEAAIAEARGRLLEAGLKFQRVAIDELRKVELAIAQTRETLTKATDKVLRTEIRSPIDGVVKSMRYYTVGGVVSPGEAIMEIVPTHDNLVVEARLNPNDVGYVRIGQPAVVKINTYDVARYGSLDAEVIYISADSHTG